MFVRQLLIGGALTLAAAFPAPTQAKEVTTWDLTKDFQPAEWSNQGLTLTPTAEGLNVQAVQQGAVIRKITTPLKSDSITITFSKGQNADMLLLWHRTDEPGDGLVQLPFSIGPDAPPQTATFDMHRFLEWDPNADVLGIAFAAGTNVTIESITFTRYSALEKLLTAWKSFWTFDQMKVYSINFLWGPLLITYPEGLPTLFDGMPPQGMSINRFYYIAILVAGLITALWTWWKKRKNSFVELKKPLLVFGGIVALLWVSYDIRMGSELLSYSVHDYQTYISKPAGEKVLRGYLNFYDALEQSLPSLKAHPRYVFLTVDGTPLPKITRYMAYPSRPIEADETIGPDVKYWFVFMRDDISVNEKGELTINGQVSSRPGKILKRFDDTSFLFETL